MIAKRHQMSCLSAVWWWPSSQRMRTFWRLWPKDVSSSTFLVRKRSRHLRLTDTCFMIPLPSDPEGLWDSSHSHGKPKKQVKAKTKQRQVFGGWVKRKHIRKTWMSSSLANRSPELGRFHSNHTPRGYSESSHFKAHLSISACSTLCDNKETRSN